MNKKILLKGASGLLGGILFNFLVKFAYKIFLGTD